MAKTATMTEEEITAKLKALKDDPTMSTDDMYSPLATEEPGGRMPFVKRHLAYLRAHKLVPPEGYLSNLALIIKKR